MKHAALLLLLATPLDDLVVLAVVTLAAKIIPFPKRIPPAPTTPAIPARKAA